MTTSRKLISMVVTVSVPNQMTAAEARREVRTLIINQCNWAADLGDVKARKVASLRGATR